VGMSPFGLPVFLRPWSYAVRHLETRNAGRCETDGVIILKKLNKYVIVVGLPVFFVSVAFFMKTTSW